MSINSNFNSRFAQLSTVHSFHVKFGELSRYTQKDIISFLLEFTDIMTSRGGFSLEAMLRMRLYFCIRISNYSNVEIMISWGIFCHTFELRDLDFSGNASQAPINPDQSIIRLDNVLTFGPVVESVDRRVVHVINETVDYLFDEILDCVHCTYLFPVLLDLLRIRGCISWKGIAATLRNVLCVRRAWRGNLISALITASFRNHFFSFETLHHIAPSSLARHVRKFSPPSFKSVSQSRVEIKRRDWMRIKCESARAFQMRSTSSFDCIDVGTIFSRCETTYWRRYKIHTSRRALTRAFFTRGAIRQLGEMSRDCHHRLEHKPPARSARSARSLKRKKSRFLNPGPCASFVSVRSLAFFPDRARWYDSRGGSRGAHRTMSITVNPSWETFRAVLTV